MGKTEYMADYGAFLRLETDEAYSAQLFMQLQFLGSALYSPVPPPPAASGGMDVIRQIIGGGDYRVVIASVTDGAVLEMEYGLDYAIYSVKAAADALLDGCPRHFSAELDGRLFILAGADRGAELEKWIGALMGRLADTCLTGQGLSVDVNCSRLCENPRELSGAYKRAKDDEAYNKFASNYCHAEDEADYEEWAMLVREQTMLSDMSGELYKGFCSMDRSNVKRLTDKAVDGVVYSFPYKLRDMQRRVRLTVDFLFYNLINDDIMVFEETQRRRVIEDLIGSPSEDEMRKKAHKYASRLMQLWGDKLKCTAVWKIERIRKYILDNSNDPTLSVSGLAEKFDLGANRMTVLFRNHFGYSVGDFIHMNRIDCAVNLLSNTHLSLAEVSRMVGFGSLNTMHRSFKKYLGFSPGAFRQEV